VLRWGDAQLGLLGEIIGAHVVQLLHEPAPPCELRHAVEKRIEATVARWPFGGRPLGAALGWLASRALLPPLADPLADRYGLPAKLGARGTSTLLWMRRPDVAAGS